MSSPENNRPIIVSEDRLRSVILEFELRLREYLDDKLLHKADVIHLTDARKDILKHDERLKSLEDWRSAQDAAADTRDKITAKQVAMWGIVATFVAGVLAAIATLVWLAVG